MTKISPFESTDRLSISMPILIGPRTGEAVAGSQDLELLSNRWDEGEMRWKETKPLAVLAT